MPVNTTYTYSGVYLTPVNGTTVLNLTTSGGDPIGFLERSHIEVYKSTDSFVANETQLTRPDDFDISVDGTQVELVTPTVTGEKYVVRRVTPLETYFTFADGSKLTEQALNRLRLLNLYRSQETQDFNDEFGVDVAAAVSAANTAVTTANTAQSTADDAATDAATAISTANSASSTASTALSTANSADTKADTAISDASSAVTTANAAIDAVGDVLPFTTVADVASIPGSPVDDEVVEVVDSTGIESFTPLTGVPGGFVGDSGLSVKIQYNLSGTTWEWLIYAPNDPEARYVAAGDAPTGGTGIDVTGTYGSGVDIDLDAGTIASLALADTAVQPARTISAGTGLTGGGDLSANRSIALSAGSIASLALADSAYQSSDLASQAEAEAGTSSTKLMTPQRTQQHLDANPPGVAVTGKTAAYTLADSDNGTLISITTGGITVPDSLSAGTTISIYNNSASDQTITEGGVGTLRSAGTTDTGNRTLAGYGLCTVQCIASGVSVISGAGLS